MIGFLVKQVDSAPAFFFSLWEMTWYVLQGWGLGLKVLPAAYI
tara:strand:- start:2431 stop:2559 length:129 start_codon:yes stop_codon:yes gene_type:complete